MIIENVLYNLTKDAFLLDQFSHNNTIIHNTFINNNQGGKQAFDAGTNNIWNDSVCGNYWSDWTTPDNDSNGIVDFPYVINSTTGAQDYYPLTDPYGVTRINVTPNATATEDLPYSFQFTAYDFDTPTLEWNMSTDAPWLILSPSALLSGTPGNDDVGDYQVNITVTDNDGHRDHSNFTLTVENVNNPPVINSTDNKTASQDTLYFNLYSAYDIDPTGDVLSWECKTNATFLGFDEAARNLSGMPNNTHIGTYWVNVSVSDGNGGTDFSNFTLAVGDINDPPYIITTPIKECNEDVDHFQVFQAVDIDPTFDQLTWSVHTNASFLKMNPDNGNLSGLPKNRDVGRFYINVSVKDDRGGNDSLNFSMEVINVNDPPMIITGDDDLAFEDEYYYVDYNVEDIDVVDSVFKWKLTTNVTWLSLDGSTGELRGTPGDYDVGFFDVNITVEDPQGANDSHQFVLQVFNKNDNPVLKPPGDLIIHEDPVAQFQFEGVDLKDGDKVYYSTDILDVVPYLKYYGEYDLNEETGLLSINATNWMVGEYLYNVTCYDLHGGSHIMLGKLVILNVNDPPFGMINSPIHNETYLEGTPLVLNCTVWDDDLIWGDQLNITWISNVTGVIGYGENISVQDLLPGHHTIMLNITDGELTFNKSINITVLAEEIPPTEDDDNVEDDSYLFLILIIIVVIVVLLVMAVLIFFVLKKPKEEEEDDIEEPETLMGDEDNLEDEQLEENEEEDVDGMLSEDDEEFLKELEIDYEDDGLYLPPAKEEDLELDEMGDPSPPIQDAEFEHLEPETDTNDEDR